MNIVGGYAPGEYTAKSAFSHMAAGLCCGLSSLVKFNRNNFWEN
jgi:hypothetical protein